MASLEDGKEKVNLDQISISHQVLDGPSGPRETMNAFHVRREACSVHEFA